MPADRVYSLQLLFLFFLHSLFSLSISTGNLPSLLNLLCAIAVGIPLTHRSVLRALEAEECLSAYEILFLLPTLNHTEEPVLQLFIVIKKTPLVTAVTVFVPGFLIPRIVMHI